jgi:hypothetical protein
MELLEFFQIRWSWFQYGGDISKYDNTVLLDFQRISKKTFLEICRIPRKNPRYRESRDTAEFRERLTRYYRIPRKNHGYPSFTWRYLHLRCLEISPFGAIGDISIGVIRNPGLDKEKTKKMVTGSAGCILLS